MCSGWKHSSKFMMVACSKLNGNGWCKTKLHGSRRIFGCLHENSNHLPPNWNCDDQLEDGCRNKIWDPGIDEDQFWKPLACVELHQSLVPLILSFGAYLKSKHWWKFQDEFKHKPP